MLLKINGKEEEAEERSTLSELIACKELDPGRIVIERNFTVIPKEKWPEVVLSPGDTLEIVSFVGGG